MTRKSGVRLSAILLALLFVPAIAFGQATQVGQLGGEVKDATGGVLPGATVTLTSVERGFTRTAVTDGQGKFLFTVVPIGRYTVNVKLQSFQAITLTDSLVEAERTTNLAISMTAGISVETTVTGSTPIVDTKNQTLETRVRAEEFQKLAVGRSYQALMGAAPGVVGTGNANVHGALSSNNIFMFDGVNTTDPTTGTFGTNLNFEAIQEVVLRTAAVGVEYGRGTGAIVDVITKSGTNRFEGSFKYLVTNDNWNEQNRTKNEVTSESLARTKIDVVNPTYSATLGGPILKNRLFFFFNYEHAKTTGAQRQTNADTARGFANENFTQTTKAPWPTFRVTAQLAPSHNVWVKYAKEKTEGFIVDYWGNAAELNALTQQNQGGDNVAAQYSGVLGTKWTASLMVARSTSFIDVIPYSTAGAIEDGATFYDLNDQRFYNGATFDGRVDRPRNQVSGAMEYFATLGGNTHQIKFGADWQGMKSENSFRYPANKIFYVLGFNPATRAYCPGVTMAPNCITRFAMEDYNAQPGDDAPSASKGNQTAFYVRDRFQLGPRASVEAGVRIEKQTGKSDVGVATIDTTDISPRISGSYSVTSDNKTILIGSVGRFYDGILQGFSDAFANVPQQGNYSSYNWNGSAYVFDFRFDAASNEFAPDVDVKPRHMDEVTVGMQRQLSNVLGVSARYIWRSWGNFVDDIQAFNADGTSSRVVTNLDTAERTYKGLELTLDKRFSNNWAAQGSYTWSETKGNHFGDDFTVLGDYVDATCRTTVDSVLGTFPCSQLQANLFGRPANDRPHMLKFGGSYRKPLGPIDLTAGFSGLATSKRPFSKTRTVSVLVPGTTAQATTQVYNYEGLGSERIDGMLFQGDLAIEGVYRAVKRSELGVKFEAFNLFNNQEKIAVSNTNWCEATTGSCATARTNFGTATARAAFNPPRTYRVSFLIRF